MVRTGSELRMWGDPCCSGEGSQEFTHIDAWRWTLSSPGGVSRRIADMVPQEDAAIVRQWAEERIPLEMRDGIRIEIDEDHHSLTLYECRPPWREDLGPEWTRVGFARLTYTRGGDEWLLECIDGNRGFRPYPQADPTRSIGELLAAIDDDPSGIFWG